VRRTGRLGSEEERRKPLFIKRDPSGASIPNNGTAIELFKQK